MKEDKRTKEIQEAIRLLGWIAVAERIRTPEDRVIFDKLGQESRDAQRASEDKILKKHHIKF